MTNQPQSTQGGQPKQQPIPAGPSAQAGRQEIKVADNIPGAEYANAMQVNHNKDEFQMMFLNIMGVSGRMAGKIITSPGHYKRMIAAMADNLKKYEERYGEVKEAEGPMNKEIGFKA
jgi:hypothetical protein